MSGLAGRLAALTGGGVGFVLSWAIFHDEFGGDFGGFCDGLGLG
jgi:hypothetical protein